jgi:hypothetical protein
MAPIQTVGVTHVLPFLRDRDREIGRVRVESTSGTTSR